jgi:hypothetical protein
MMHVLSQLVLKYEFIFVNVKQIPFGDGYYSGREESKKRR